MVVRQRLMHRHHCLNVEHSCNLLLLGSCCVCTCCEYSAQMIHCQISEHAALQLSQMIKSMFSNPLLRWV